MFNAQTGPGSAISAYPILDIDAAVRLQASDEDGRGLVTLAGAASRHRLGFTLAGRADLAGVDSPSIHR